MKFGGLQKLSLLDYPGRMACTVFTAGCNFRCPYCHNPGLVIFGEASEWHQDYTAEEILDFLKKRRNVLEGVAVTGGEPLLHEELEGFIAEVKDLGYLVKLDTNGSKPEFLKRLVSRNLVDRVAMDIKNSPDEYGRTVGLESFDIAPVEESKEFLLDMAEKGGGPEVEFRMTVVKGLHTADSLEAAAKWIEGSEEYYLQGFVNEGRLLRPEGLEAFTKEEMESFLERVRKYVPRAELRGI